MGDLGYQDGEPYRRQAQPVPAIPANDPCLSLPSDLPQGLPMGWTQQKPVSKRAPGGADSGVEKSGKCMQRSKGADIAKPPPSAINPALPKKGSITLTLWSAVTPPLQYLALAMGTESGQVIG